MAQLYKTAACLRIKGDTLIPDEISRLLGARPSLSRAKGDEILGHKTGTVRIARTGQWHIDARDREPEDVDGQISEILEQLTDDIEIWAALSQEFEIDLFCGWFMEESDEGLEISTASLTALGSRGIKLGVCLYAPTHSNEELDRLKDIYNS